MYKFNPNAIVLWALLSGIGFLIAGTLDGVVTGLVIGLAISLLVNAL